ncbi:MAG: zf-HC2 domain-containing protein [Gemmatimonadota bacterium]|nr:zf-HC2 domain-containing protein [Gemmatimonadota bacterium]
MSILDSIKRLFGGVPTNGAQAGPGGNSSDADMISCEDALQLVHDYLDGELVGVSEGRVRAHFEACSRCYPHLQLESSYREAVRRAVAGEMAPSGLRKRVTDLLAEASSGD